MLKKKCQNLTWMTLFATNRETAKHKTQKKTEQLTCSRMNDYHFSSPFEKVMFPVRFRSVTFGALQQHPGRRAAEQTATEAEGRNKFIPWDRKWLPHNLWTRWWGKVGDGCWVPGNEVNIYGEQLFVSSSFIIVVGAFFCSLPGKITV